MLYAQLLAIPAILLLYLSWRWRRKWKRLYLSLPWALLTLLITASAGYSIWYCHRPIPPAERRELAPGVTYIRALRSLPRPLVIHVVEIDLDQPGLEFFVTPRVEGRIYKPVDARTGTRFVEEFGVLVAINACFFYPWHSQGPFDYYPHEGDPVDVCGESWSQGRNYSYYHDGYTNFEITKDNRVNVSNVPRYQWNVISVKEQLLRDGEIVAPVREDWPLMPETAIAVDQTGRRLYWIVIDGRQPNYSEGVWLHELAQICKDFGAWNAYHLDGGGSSTLVGRDDKGQPRLMNSPIHGRHPPGRERPVGNHLGILLPKR